MEYYVKYMVEEKDIETVIQRLKSSSNSVLRVQRAPIPQDDYTVLAVLEYKSPKTFDAWLGRSTRGHKDIKSALTMEREEYLTFFENVHETGLSEGLVLINCDQRRTEEVVQNLAKISGVRNVCFLGGMYDISFTLQASSVDELRQRFLNKICKLGGVERSMLNQIIGKVN